MDINTAFRKLEELFTLLVLIFVVLPGCSQIEQSKKEKVKQVKKSRLRDNDLNFLDIKKLLPDRSARKTFGLTLMVIIKKILFLLMKLIQTQACSLDPRKL